MVYMTTTFKLQQDHENAYQLGRSKEEKTYMLYRQRATLWCLTFQSLLHYDCCTIVAQFRR